MVAVTTDRPGHVMQAQPQPGWTQPVVAHVHGSVRVPMVVAPIVVANIRATVLSMVAVTMDQHGHVMQVQPHLGWTQPVVAHVHGSVRVPMVVAPIIVANIRVTVRSMVAVTMDRPGHVMQVQPHLGWMRAAAAHVHGSVRVLMVVAPIIVANIRATVRLMVAGVAGAHVPQAVAVEHKPAPAIILHRPMVALHVQV
jgi:hypothetical protein